MKEAVADIQIALKKHLAKEGVVWLENFKWRFDLPAYTPHMGGCWERLVRSVKTALKVILIERTPKEDTLATALVVAENIVNSRPLTYLSLDDIEDDCLTPNHFLKMSSSEIRDPTQIEAETLNLKKQWHQVEEITDHFRKRWVAEYLPTLTKRTKWFTKAKPIEKDDIVIICDGQHRGNDWRRGLVVEVVKGSGDQVRAAFVKTSEGNVRKYPAVRLAVINIEKRI